MSQTVSDEPRPSSASQRALDWLNFFIADVQTGFGPFVALYLASRGWPQSEIGLLLTVGGVAAILSQVPSGALVDAAPAKRLLVAIGLAAIAGGALMFAFFPQPIPLFLAETLHGSVGAVIKTALAAIGLGLVGHRGFSSRLGRNQRHSSFGNALTAAAMGVLGHFVGKESTFVLAAILCLPAAYALTRIRGSEIDYARARSARQREKPREATRFRELWRNRPLLIVIAGLTVFYFANASVVPLASERLAQQNMSQSELVTAALVVVPQVVTGLIAAWVALLADRRGRKPLLLVGFAILPLRALLFALAPSPWYLVGFQAFGGITAAVIGILIPLVIADVTRGSGRFNFAQGIVGLATGVGASLSTAFSGYVAEAFGYLVAFVGLAFVGLIGSASFFGSPRR